MEWILNRLSEPSTWRGLIYIATAAGITVSPDMMAAITAAGLALVGLINVIRKERKNDQSGKILPWAKSENPTLKE